MRPYLILPILLFTFLNSFATICHPNGITVNNTSEFLNLLSSCDTIGGDLIFQGNFTAPTFPPTSLSVVLGDFRILKSNQFTLTNTLQSLTHIGGDLQISFCSSIQLLSSFQNVQHIGGDLILQGNSGIQTIKYLNNLQSIGGKIIIEGNDQLMAINGLESLFQMDGAIVIQNNSVLECIYGLKNIAAAGIDNLTIKDCPQLSICQLDNFCDYIVGNGSATIENNAPGCNLVTEITVGCVPINCPTSDVEITNAFDDLNYEIIYKNCTSINHDIYVEFDAFYEFDYNHDKGFNAQVENLQGNIFIQYNQVNLPTLGFNNLQSISGSISIINNPSIVRLDGFSSLQSIGGNLIIEGYDFLFPFASLLWGFNSLDTIEGNLEYRNNAAAEILPILPTLTTINGDIIIETNNVLNFEMIANVEQVGGNIHISNNPNLLNLFSFVNIDPTSFSNLIIENNPNVSFCHLPNFCDYLEQGGAATISGNGINCTSVQDVESECNEILDCQINSVVITSQSDLNLFQAQYPFCNKIDGTLMIESADNLAAFQNIDTILGSLRISDLNSEDLNDLQNLEYIGGSLILNGQTNFENLTGLSNLNYIGGAIAIDGNFGLKNLQGLDGLTFVGGDIFVLNSTIEDMSNDCPNLSSFAGNITFENNTLLTHTPIFDNVSNSSGGFSCTGNNQLKTIQGFNNGTFLNGNLYIENNDSLFSINAFQNIETITGNFQLKSNLALTEIQGFGNVKNIEQFVTLYENELLTALPFTSLESVNGNFLISKSNAANLSGLQNLETINGNFEITNNQLLTNIADLINLQTVGGYLAIFNNNLLTSLDGLQNIDPSTISNLFLYGSDLLSDCSVQSICDYLNDPMNPSSVNTNASGCLNEEEILAACSFTNIENTHFDFARIYPNPAANEVFVETFLSSYNLSIQNTIGQVVLEMRNTNNNSFDISGLENGVYIVIIEGGKAQIVKEKLIVSK